MRRVPSRWQYSRLRSAPIASIAGGRVDAGVAGTLSINDQSWNRIANVLWIESPAGVGFSYSNTSTDYYTNNNKTAADNLVFLESWLELFPQYKSNALFIAGESYAGDYGPQLVLKILESGNTALINQLQGMMLGNPVLSCAAWKQHQKTIQLELFFWHGLVPIRTLNQWREWKCDVNPTARCDKLYYEAEYAIGPFDPDDLYTNEYVQFSQL